MLNEENKIAKGLRIAAGSANKFLATQPLQSAAAVSYYTLLSIAPLLLVVIGVAGLLLDQNYVREALVNQTSGLVGEEGGTLLRSVIENANEPGQDLLSISIGALLVFVGATTVFAQLQTVLNKIWRVKATPSNALVGLLRARLISLGVVFVIGFLLLVSLMTSAMMQGLHDYLLQNYPNGVVLLKGAHLIFSFGLTVVLFALLYQYVPDAHIEWRDAWAGGTITSALFSIGKYSIGLYLGQVSVGSAHGAAGSAVVFMVWVYYASLIVFAGAHLTAELALYRGRPVIPLKHAEPEELPS